MLSRYGSYLDCHCQIIKARKTARYFLMYVVFIHKVEFWWGFVPDLRLSTTFLVFAPSHTSVVQFIEPVSVPKRNECPFAVWQVSSQNFLLFRMNPLEIKLWCLQENTTFLCLKLSTMQWFPSVLPTQNKFFKILSSVELLIGAGRSRSITEIPQGALIIDRKRSWLLLYKDLSIWDSNASILKTGTGTHETMGMV